MKKILAFLLVLLNIGMVMCSGNNISQKDIEEMKDVVDKVLSYDGGYDNQVSEYIDSNTFNESNYVIFYSYYIGSVVLNKYESHNDDYGYYYSEYYGARKKRKLFRLGKFKRKTKKHLKVEKA